MGRGFQSLLRESVCGRECSFSGFCMSLDCREGSRNHFINIIYLHSDRCIQLGFSSSDRDRYIQLASQSRKSSPHSTKRLYSPIVIWSDHASRPTHTKISSKWTMPKCSADDAGEHHVVPSPHLSRIPIVREPLGLPISCSSQEVPRYLCSMSPVFGVGVHWKG